MIVAIVILSGGIVIQQVIISSAIKERNRLYKSNQYYRHMMARKVERDAESTITSRT